MKKEFKLSEKVVFDPNGINWVSEKNIKEFIKILKERFNIGKKNWRKEEIYEIIDEETGDLKS